MKLVKMSLAAAVLLGASAFAVDNIKVSGDAKLYYSTNNQELASGSGTKSDELFSKSNASADTAVRVGVTGDLTKGVSFGMTGYAVSTLGLENNLVNGTWTGAHDAHTGTPNAYHQVDDQAWMGEAWIAATVGKTTAKLGRMELDTPLAFSEKWSIVPNTFDAAVLINQDLPDTTLVGAWVGKGNGTNAVSRASGISIVNFATNNQSGLDSNGLALDGGVVGAGANFGTFAHGGAYAVAAINNSIKPLVAQAWYYNVAGIADAYWLQADWDCQLIKDVKVGVQYANMSPKGVLKTAIPTIKDSSAYAVKLAYAGVKNLNVSAAYSSTDKDGTLKIANVATNNLNGAQSKLFTETKWNYGYVGAPGADTVNVAAEYNVEGIAKLGASATCVSAKAGTNTVSDSMNEVALTASKSFGPLDAKLAYISTDTSASTASLTALNGGKRFDTVQAYLTLNF